MQMDVSIAGLEQAKARMAAIGKNLAPVLRGTLNTTATKTRSERFAKPMAAVFGARGKAMKRIALKRANSNRTNSRLIPSSSGVPITEFKGWTYEPISKTRARIMVNGLHGRKLAAGFVNPSSDNRKALRTTKTKKVAGALGPSAAYFFKQLNNPATLRWVNAFMRQELEKRLRKAEAGAAT